MPQHARHFLPGTLKIHSSNTTISPKGTTHCRGLLRSVTPGNGEILYRKYIGVPNFEQRKTYLRGIGISLNETISFRTIGIVRVVITIAFLSSEASMSGNSGHFGSIFKNYFAHRKF